MKVRVGYSPGTAGMAGMAGVAVEGVERGFGPFVDDLERLGFDSLWLSERVGTEVPDPVAALAFAAGRTRRLKLGTSVVVVPGRNPVLLAKQMAILDRLSGGRFLPAVGLGVADPHEQAAFGVPREERAAWFDEALPLLRRFWSGEPVVHRGDRFSYDGVQVRPTPAQAPLEVWLGGRAPSELRRVGRLGDGWLPSFCTPAEAAAGRRTVEEAATGAGRAIDPEHWGALVAYTRGPLPDRFAALLARRRPDVAPTDVVPAGLPAARATLERFCEQGFSKFVLLPVAEPADWSAELGEVAAEVLPLQT